MSEAELNPASRRLVGLSLKGSTAKEHNLPLASTPQLALELSAVSQREDASASPPIFRPIHYLGSKLRLIEPIRDVLNAVDPSRGPVCDLFAGSGTVSMAFRQDRQVVAVDIQEYSRVLCSALLNPLQLSAELASHVDYVVHRSDLSHKLRDAVAPLLTYENECIAQAIGGHPEPLCDLLEHGSLLAAQNEFPSSMSTQLQRALNQTRARLVKAKLVNSPASMALRHFGGIYFSYHQAALLDLILEAIHTSDVNTKDPLVAALLSTASEIVNTVGKQFAQPIRPRSKKGAPKRHLIAKIDRDRAIDVWAVYRSWLEKYCSLPATGRRHQAVRADFRDALEDLRQPLSIVYADPPYTRDHYSRFYHVLETLCYRDDPDISTVTSGKTHAISRGMYRESRHQSPFCIKSQAPAAFEALFKGVRAKDIPLVVSYSPFAAATRARPRLMSVENIKSLASRYYRSVEVASAGRIAHSKLNTTELNAAITYDAEILLVCIP